jgi:hypothetical protein
LTDALLLAVERRPFLVAVTGSDSSRQAARATLQQFGLDADVSAPHEAVPGDSV